MSVDSLLHLYQKSYYKLPRPVKVFLGSLYGNLPLSVRFGKQYDIHRKIIEKFINADEQYQLDYQYNKTVETLQFAQDYIPYYQKIFREYGFSIDQFKELNDLRKLPCLTKSIIQEEIENLYTDKLDKPTSLFSGGSSATPTKMYVPLSISRSKEKAYTNYIFSQIGYRYRDRMIALNGRGNYDEDSSIYWEYQMIDNMLLVSVNHLEKRFIESIFNAIQKAKPKYFYGYGSAIVSFIKACRAVGIEHMDGIKGVIFASESIFMEDVDLARDFFQTQVLSHYGHTERVNVAYRLDRGAYQFCNSYGLARIVDDEIVGTSFDNIVMPYINYKTQDYISGDRDYYNGTEIVKSAEMIQGRIQEHVVTKDGDPITILSIGAGHYDSYDYVNEAQFYQDTPGKVILYVRSDHPEKVQTERMVEQMEAQVKHKIDFEVKLVDKIEKSSRGKRILCIQKLDIEKYRNR